MGPSCSMGTLHYHVEAPCHMDQFRLVQLGTVHGHIGKRAVGLRLKGLLVILQGHCSIPIWSAFVNFLCFFSIHLRRLHGRPQNFWRLLPRCKYNFHTRLIFLISTDIFVGRWGMPKEFIFMKLFPSFRASVKRYTTDCRKCWLCICVLVIMLLLTGAAIFCAIFFTSE